MKTIKHTIPSSAKKSSLVKKILDDKQALREHWANVNNVISSSETKPDHQTV